MKKSNLISSVLKYYTPEIIIMISLAVIVLLSSTTEPMTSEEIKQINQTKVEYVDQH